MYDIKLLSGRLIHPMYKNMKTNVRKDVTDNRKGN